ncbi:uroporphyrinogen decarboxylase family protein [Lachnospiraceae bacterium LCP25S3_G4]
MKVTRYKSDEMVPKERARAIEKGQDFDRFPIYPFLGEIDGKLIGKNAIQYWHERESFVQAEIMAYERWGHDEITVGPNTKGIAEALGANIIYKAQGFPYAGEPSVLDYQWLHRMDPMHISNSKQMIFVEEILKYSTDLFEDILTITVSMGGPFTIASFLRGIENLLRDVRKNPESVHALMRVVTDSVKACIDVVSRYDIKLCYADPVAGPNLISPKNYKEFVLPYMKEIVTYGNQKTAYQSMLHMCGDSRRLWPILKEIPMGSFSVDNVIELNEAVEEMGQQFMIIGNVPPVEVIMNGEQEEIAQSVKVCIKKGASSQKGYIVAPGCNIPYTTELRNIDWFVEASRLYGTRKRIAK